MKDSLRSLTAARAVAAACVVISHLHGLGIINAPGLHRFLDGGRPAVAFFFVLSGFVLAYNYPVLEGRRAVGNFWLARAARVYPMHLCALLVGVLCMSIVIGRGDLALSSRFWRIGPDYFGLGLSPWLFAALGLIAQLAMLTAWLPVGVLNQPYNGASWSISCEAFFYATFPALIAVVSRRSTRQVVALLGAAWVIQLAWLGLVRGDGPVRGFLLFQFPVSHLFEFVLGLGLAVLSRRGVPAVFKDRAVLIVVGALAIIAALRLVPLPDPAGFFAAPLFGIMILAMAEGRAKLDPVLGIAPFVFLGEISYAAYILHVPMIELGLALGLPHWAMAMSPVAVLVVSSAAFLFIEEPARRKIRGLRDALIRHVERRSVLRVAT